jgi:protein-L-isoaspartate(D-aspartate) O-methyltransferase
MTSTFTDEHFAAARAQMVQTQLRGRGLRDERVLAAMATVPREHFLPDSMRERAYDDNALPIGHGQTMSQPYMVARACELARLQPTDRVLDVGAGSGYQAAVLAQLCAHVTAIELVETLAAQAAERVAALAIPNLDIVQGDGTRGHPAAAPYDAILVAAGAPVVPAALVEQLAEGGRLVIPLGGKYSQVLTVLHKRGDEVEREAVDACVYVPLRGAGGWTDDAPR